MFDQEIFLDALAAGALTDEAYAKALETASARLQPLLRPTLETSTR